MSKRILYIAYFYPPLGGPGVQRPIKTIKYLKKNGYYVDVLTVNDIQFHSYDYELLNESKADNIYRTGSLDPMSILKRIKIKKKNKDKIYFNTPEKIKRIIRGIFPVDSKIGWMPFAYRKGLILIKENNYDCIIATIGPLTAGILAYQLHKKTKLPYYIDYRDHLTTHVYPQYIFEFLRKHAEKYEKKMQQQAKGIFMAGNLMKNRMVKHFGDFLKVKTKIVYNGFDEDDFLEPIQRESSMSYIRFVGNIYGNQNLEYFLKAIKFLKNNDHLPNNVIFEFIGNYYLETYNLLTSEDLKPYINLVPQKTYKEAVRLTRSADMLLLFLATKDQEDIIPGKLFEYIGSNNPIFAMVPENGEVADILRSLGHKYICNMESTDQIIQYFQDFFNKKTFMIPKIDHRYSRESQTKIIIEVIERDLA